jgi:hypothetical protein
VIADSATSLTVSSGVTFTVAGTLESLKEGGLVTTGATLTIEEGGQVIENVSEEYKLSTVDNSETTNNTVLGSPTVLNATAKKVRTAATAASPTVTITVEKVADQTLGWVEDFKDATSSAIWGTKPTGGSASASGKWTDIAITLTSVFTPLSGKKVSVKQTSQALRYYENAATNQLATALLTEPVYTTTAPFGNIWIPALTATDNLPVKWRGYNDASSLVKSGQSVNGTTWGILLWNAATTQPPQIALEIYDESDTTRKLVTKIEIDYSALLP